MTPREKLAAMVANELGVEGLEKDAGWLGRLGVAAKNIGGAIAARRPIFGSRAYARGLRARRVAGAQTMAKARISGHKEYGKAMEAAGRKGLPQAAAKTKAVKVEKGIVGGAAKAVKKDPFTAKVPKAPGTKKKTPRAPGGPPPAATATATRPDAPGPVTPATPAPAPTGGGGGGGMAALGLGYGVTSGSSKTTAAIEALLNKTGSLTDEEVGQLISGSMELGFADHVEKTAKGYGYAPKKKKKADAPEGQEKTAAFGKKSAKGILYSKYDVNDIIEHLAGEFGREEPIEKDAAAVPTLRKFSSMLKEELTRPT